MIDLHCHLLPAVDDGPPDLAAAIALARAQVDAGVTTVACTPHVPSSGDDTVTAARIERAVEELRPALDEAGIPLDVVPGAEVGLTWALDVDDEELARLRLGGGPWLLLESPHRQAVGIESAIQHVALRGHHILLAHPERCPAFQQDPEALTRLVRQGTVLTQMTASALTGRFGSRVERFARHLVDEGLVHVVASDAHDAVHRGPGLTPALEEAGYGDLAPLLTNEIPAAMVAGDRVPPLPASRRSKPTRRRWWRRG